MQLAVTNRETFLESLKSQAEYLFGRKEPIALSEFREKTETKQLWFNADPKAKQIRDACREIIFAIEVLGGTNSTDGLKRKAWEATIAAEKTFKDNNISETSSLGVESSNDPTENITYLAEQLLKRFAVFKQNYDVLGLRDIVYNMYDDLAITAEEYAENKNKWYE